MPRHVERSKYCQERAEECASRAGTTNLPELKDAYLQLELGWRQLIPEFDPVPNQAINAKTGQASDPEAQKTKGNAQVP